MSLPDGLVGLQERFWRAEPQGSTGRILAGRVGKVARPDRARHGHPGSLPGGGIHGHVVGALRSGRDRRVQPGGGGRLHRLLRVAVPGSPVRRQDPLRSGTKENDPGLGRGGSRRGRHRRHGPQHVAGGGGLLADGLRDRRGPPRGLRAGGKQRRAPGRGDRGRDHGGLHGFRLEPADLRLAGRGLQPEGRDDRHRVLHVRGLGGGHAGPETPGRRRGGGWGAGGGAPPPRRPAPRAARRPAPPPPPPPPPPPG